MVSPVAKAPRRTRRSWDQLLVWVALVRLLWSAAPVWATIAVVTAVLSAAVTVVAIPLVGELIGAVAAVLAGDGGTERVWFWFVLLAASQVVAQLIGFGITVSNARCARRLVTRLMCLVAEAGMAPPDLAAIEGSYGNRLRSLDRNLVNWELAMAPLWIWHVLTIRLTGLGALVVAMTWRPWVGLLAALSVVGVGHAFGVWQRRFTELSIGEASEETRRSQYLRDLLVQPSAAKEVRLFGWAGWLTDRYRRAWQTADGLRWQGAGGSLVPLAIASLVSMVVIGGALALLGVDASSGLITVATVVTIAQALVGLEALGILGDAQTYSTKLASLVHSVATERRSIGLDPVRPEVASQPPQPSRPGPAAIEICDLSFTYPARSDPTIHGLDLDIPAGQSVALVGLNGAGKTTLINLICGLRRPDAGQILVDGVPVDGPQAGTVAAIFQDFQHYPLSLRDNVGFGAPELLDGPDSRFTDVLDQIGGATVRERVAEGHEGDPWDRVLTSDQTGGTDLSGGQWQRIALARAMTAVAGGARVLILDEPAAALDVRAEAELFDRFVDLTADVTTILVSHRLSSVRRADRILVLDGAAGHIVEDGSHHELMAANGGYARLYRLQAERFAAAAGESDTAPDSDAVGR